MSFLRANGEGTEDRKKTSIKQSQLKLFNNWKVHTFLCLNQFSAHSSDYKRVGALQLGPGHRIPELTAFDSSVIVIKYC